MTAVETTVAVTVREADPGEYDAIADLLVTAYTSRFWVTDWYRENLRRVAEHARTSHWWVAVDAAGTILGAARTPRGERPGPDPTSREATFGLLGTDPAVAGRGVATALVDALVERARAAGFDAVAIWSGPQMTGAHRLYERLGFVRCGERETKIVDGGQRLRSYVLPLRDGLVFRPPVASPIDFDAYGTIYQPRNVPRASTALGAQAYPFRDRVAGPDGPPAEPGRYHLYVSWACPFAQRVAIVRALKGLETVIPLWVVDPIRDGRGWAFRDGRGQTRDGGGGGFALLREAYDATVGGQYEGRISVPVLWDSVERRIVSNAYDQLTVDLGRAFDAVAEHPEVDLYPAELAAEIDEVDARVHATLSTGVYAAGFARTQQAYDRAVREVFDTLAWLEGRLAGREFLVGDRLTEADVRIWPTLARFDLVYHGHFKVNLRRLADHPALQAYAARLATIPAFGDTTDVDHIRRHYYGTQRHLNPLGIVPVGPNPDWLPAARAGS